MSTLHEANEFEELGQTPEQRLEAAGAPASLYSDEERKVRSGQSKGMVPPVKVSDIVLDFDVRGALSNQKNAGSSLQDIEEGQQTKRRSGAHQSKAKTKLKQLKKLERVIT